MKSILLCFLFSTQAYAVSQINTGKEIKIEFKNENVEIQVPAAAKEALNKWNSQFNVFGRSDYSAGVLKHFKEAELNEPMAFIADLDNDGRKDLVLLGQDVKTQYAIALMQKKKKWTVVEVKSWSITDIKKSEVPTLNGEEKELGVPFYILEAQGAQAEKLKNKIGIQIETYLSDGEVFEIKNDKAVILNL